jgi:ABC-type dipeptide/oligopeptide/nickel transport system permease subunit
MDTVKKKLVIPIIVFLIAIVVNMNSISRGIDKHETWRVVLAASSSVLMIAFAIVAWVMLSRQKKNPTGN